MSIAEDLNVLIAELATGPSTDRRREIVQETKALVTALSTQPKSQPKAPRKGR